MSNPQSKEIQTAEQFLNEALGGNMNIRTLTPLAWHEIMESYAKYYHKAALKQSIGVDEIEDAIKCFVVGNSISGSDTLGMAKSIHKLINIPKPSVGVEVNKEMLEYLRYIANNLPESYPIQAIKSRAKSIVQKADKLINS